MESAYKSSAKVSFCCCMEILHWCTPQKTYMRSIRSSGVGKCLLVRSWGRGINHQERKKLQLPGGIPRGGGGMVSGQIEPCIILICNSSFETTFWVPLHSNYNRKEKHSESISGLPPLKTAMCTRNPNAVLAISWAVPESLRVLIKGIWIRLKMVYAAGFKCSILSGTWQSRLKFPLLLTILGRHSCVSIKCSREENRVIFCLFSSFPRRVNI